MPARSPHSLAAYVRSSLWLLPVLSTPAGLLAARAVRWVDERTQWTLMAFGPQGARELLSTVAGALLTFIVFAFSILLLAIQQAGAQLSPRIIAWIFQRRLAKMVLSTFVFSFAYSLAALARVEEAVPQLTVVVAILFTLISITLFVMFIQAAGQGFRPIAILTRIGDETRKVIEEIFPRPFEAGADGPETLAPVSSGSPRELHHRGRAEVFQAFHQSELVRIASRAGCTIELVPAVGDFVAPGDVLLRLHGEGAGRAGESRLRRCLELGPERTIEQDPAFGIRTIVDVANKALSPAINDPTTAVLALDQLHHLLHLLGRRRLDENAVRDASGAVRLVFRSPRWDDFVELAVTEIRLYGSTSPQVSRRMTAMLEHLAEVLPAERGEVARRELAKLRRNIETGYVDPADRALAAAPDRQGLGSRVDE